MPPRLNGLEFVRRVDEQMPDLVILVLTGPHATSVLARQLRHPGSALDHPWRDPTGREPAAFRLLIEGLTSKEAARCLGISATTFG